LDDQQALEGLPFRDRVFVAEHKTRYYFIARWHFVKAFIEKFSHFRRLLHQFATGEVNGRKQDMQEEDVRRLVHRIRLEFPESPLLELIQRLSEAGPRAPDAYKLFLEELSKNTPVSGFLQLGRDADRAIQELRKIIRGDLDIGGSLNLDSVRQLRLWCPGLLKCLISIRKAHVVGLPGDVRGVLNMLLQKLACLREFSDIRRQVPVTSSLGDTEHRTSFFPLWPVQRGFSKYSDDGRSQKDEADTCNKYKTRRKILGPGIVAYLCPHGVSYGYTVMENFESPRMPFEILSTRFTPDSMPEVVIYDNACKLHNYCLKREPAMFREVRFFVDRFHWANHRACSIGYCINLYSGDKVLPSVNTQVAEQLNSCMKKLRKSLSFMSFKKFMCHLQLFLYLYNERKIVNVPLRG
jgi:hypothetical protein